MNKKLCFILMTSFLGVFQHLSADDKVVVTDIKGEKISFLLSSNPVVSFDTYSLILKTDDESTDDNEDEFKFFALRSDNPFDTYHIEFRYGSKEEGILDYFSGKYAYWMAAGVLENDDNQCEKSIRLFVKENLEPRVE